METVLAHIIAVLIIVAILSTIVTFFEYVYIKISSIIKNKKGDHNG